MGGKIPFFLFQGPKVVKLGGQISSWEGVLLGIPPLPLIPTPGRPTGSVDNQLPSVVCHPPSVDRDAARDALTF